MMQALGALLLALSLVASSAVPLAAVPAATRHSGTVTAIDPEGGVMLLDEVGPWRVEGGQTVVTRRTITLTPETKFNKFIRVNAPGGFPGEFVEVEYEPGFVDAGDFVTAECVSERGRLVALTVTVAELD
jgi:hypothetical protein